MKPNNLISDPLWGLFVPYTQKHDFFQNDFTQLSAFMLSSQKKKKKKNQNNSIYQFVIKPKKLILGPTNPVQGFPK